MKVSLTERSKSQRKRESKALQVLGEELVRLSPSQLDQMLLPEHLRDAVLEARGLSHGAYRRQIRYLGKLIGDADVAAIRHALGELSTMKRQSTKAFHRIEHWRGRLVEEGNAALEDLLSAFPTADYQRIRQLLRVIEKERIAKKPPRAYRALFRYLHDLNEQS